MKKYLPLLILTLAALTLFAACSGGEYGEYDYLLRHRWLRHDPPAEHR